MLVNENTVVHSALTNVNKHNFVNWKLLKFVNTEIIIN